MAGFRDLQNWLKEVFTPGRSGETRRPDGGTSCYRPMRRKNPEEREAQAKAAEYAAEQQQIPYVHTGFTNMNPPAGGGYSQAPMNDPYGYGAAQAARQREQQAYAQQPYTGMATGNNISYMPGVSAPETGFSAPQEGGPQGNSFSHVEHILTMTSLKSCYEAIECMKNGESLIVTLDAIADGGESIRCQDMLCGAAFTLGCTVRMLQGGAVVLIAPPGVQVLPEQTRAQAWSDPMGAQWPGTMNAAAPEAEYAPRRERRVSQNAAGWGQASSESNRYWNPYTGTMPAAAGDYGTYGGYGYYARE